MDFKFLSQTPLFQGNTEEETERVLSCLKAREKRYRKDEIIFYAGDPTTSMGLVLSGSVFIEKVDIWGNRSILDRIEKGHTLPVKIELPFTLSRRDSCAPKKRGSGPASKNKEGKEESQK